MEKQPSRNHVEILFGFAIFMRKTKYFLESDI